MYRQDQNIVQILSLYNVLFLFKKKKQTKGRRSLRFVDDIAAFHFPRFLFFPTLAAPPFVPILPCGLCTQDGGQTEVPGVRIRGTDGPPGSAALSEASTHTHTHTSLPQRVAVYS